MQLINSDVNCIRSIILYSLSPSLSRYRMNHPIKRFKANDLDRNRINRHSQYDLYAGQTCIESPSTLPNLVQMFGNGVKNEWKGDDAKNNPNNGGKQRSESEADKNSTSESLFTNEGLQPSYADLNKIFDNSDDNSNDDHVSGEFIMQLCTRMTISLITLACRQHTARLQQIHWMPSRHGAL